MIFIVEQNCVINNIGIKNNFNMMLYHLEIFRSKTKYGLVTRARNSEFSATKLVSGSSAH